MANHQVRIGPWPRGLNTINNKMTVPDSQLSSIVNLDVQNDGTLIPRRGFTFVENPSGVATDGAALTGWAGPGTYKNWNKFNILGEVTLPSSSNSFIIAQDIDDFKLYYLSSAYYHFRDAADYSAGTWQQTPYWPTQLYSSVLSYNGLIYFIPTIAGGGASATSLSGGVLTALANMPVGNRSFIHKDRLFIANNDTIYFSKSTDFSVWAAPDGGFFKIDQDSPDYITETIVQGNNIIIFKLKSTYVFTYSTDPVLDGSLRTISADMGAFSATIYNNDIYLVNYESVYRLVNLYFQDIAVDLNLGISRYDSPENTDANRPLYAGALTTTGLSGTTNTKPNISFLKSIIFVCGDTLMLLATPPAPLSSIGSCSGYAMNLKTGSWSSYDFDFGLYIQREDVPLAIQTDGYVFLQGGYRVAKNRLPYGNLVVTSDTGIIPTLADGVSKKAAVIISPYYGMETKLFSSFQSGRYLLGDESEWKRLYWWAFNDTEEAFSDPAVLYNKIYSIPDYEDSVVRVSADSSGYNAGKISTTSARFKNICFGMEAPAIINVYSTFHDLSVQVRSITAYIGVKATITQ